MYSVSGCFAFEVVHLVLIKDKEVLDRQSKRLHNFSGALSLVRRHEFTELAQVEEVAANLGEFFAELLQRFRSAAKVADDEVRIGLESERRLLQLKDLLRRNALQHKDERADQVPLPYRLR